MGPIAKWLTPVALGGVLVASGCGGEEKVLIPAQPGPEDERVAPQQNVRVDMRDIAFNPRVVAVNAGGTITWTNEDRVAHTVTKRDGVGPRFNSGDVAPTRRYRRSFDTPGQISYLCTIHANMTATIRVVE